MQLKTGVSSVENGFAVSFSGNVSLVCWTEINLFLLNVKSWEAPCCLFHRSRGCCLAIGVYSVLTQNRETRREVL